MASPILANLPDELYIMILQHCLLVTDLAVSTHAKSSLTAIGEALPAADPLRVSQVMNQAGMKIFYTDNTFSFTEPSVLNDFLACIGPRKAQLITRIRISAATHTWVDFFRSGDLTRLPPNLRLVELDGSSYRYSFEDEPLPRLLWNNMLAPAIQELEVAMRDQLNPVCQIVRLIPGEVDNDLF
ncbi:hypothetical protein MMC11_000991 [Xylographa trunciseda]|nr:hypothetical protein [Xylographa trunciseda]